LAAWVSAIDEWLDGVPIRRRVVDYIREQAGDVYLVGGAVRDAILGRESLDLDVAVVADAMGLARRVADRFRAAYVPLDASRDVARVVWCDGRRRHHFDFAGLRAEGIESDLRARDFTINAMAVSLSSPWGELLDPTGGLGDLRAGLLRAASPAAFINDPVRILRLVRLRGALRMRVVPETESLARQSVHSLRHVSPERVRDELVDILELADSASSLEYAGGLGLAPQVLPEMTACAEDWAHGLAVLRWLEHSCGLLSRESPAPGLERFAGRVAEHLAESLAGGRSRCVALKIAALCRARPDASAVPERLHMSTREVRYVDGVVRAAGHLAEDIRRAPPDALSVHRYFRDFGEEGVGGALLSLALAGGTMGTDVDYEQRALRWAEVLLDAWFESHDRLVDPPALVTGRDVLRAVGGVSGPIVGRLLAQVREAQVQGLVSDRPQALAYLKERCSNLTTG